MQNFRITCPEATDYTAVTLRPSKLLSPDFADLTIPARDYGIRTARNIARKKIVQGIYRHALSGLFGIIVRPMDIERVGSFIAHRDSDDC